MDMYFAIGLDQVVQILFAFYHEDGLVTITLKNVVLEKIYYEDIIENFI